MSQVCPAQFTLQTLNSVVNSQKMTLGEFPIQKVACTDTKVSGLFQAFCD